jgi:hypothetical protein
MATKQSQNETITLRAEVRQLTKIVALLTRRLGAFEKQMRSMKARAHQAGLNMDALERSSKRDTRGPYDPPSGGLTGRL